MKTREHAALAALAGRERDLVEFARELLATPSPNPPGDERAVVELVRGRMAALGYDLVTVLARADERPNLVGEIGRGRPTLMLNGHLDTQPPGIEAEWATGPYDPVLRDSLLYGLGASDMKASVAAMVYAGAAVAAAGEPAGTLKVVLTADEEAGSHFGARFLAAEGSVEADAVLVGEATALRSPWECVALVSRGSSRFRVRTRGTQMHTGLSDRLPSVNASVKMAQVIARMAESFRPAYPPDPLLPGGPAVNLGVTVKGGIAFAFYPGEAEFGVDVRTTPGMTLKALRADVEGFLERLRREDPELDVAVEWVPGMEWLPPSALIRPDHPLVRAAQGAALAVLGRPVPCGMMPAWTDASYWCAAGFDCIPAFGPGLLPLAHRPNEHVAVREIVEAARIFALTALRYFDAARAAG